ncbi:MAG: EamA family transporter [Proteobacteria bacterium]|nr:EamA family transporter [Pseudomonadota bacterium]
MQNLILTRQQAHNPILGISAMLLSVLLFSMMDATVKWLGSTYPTQQIMFFRCLVATIPVAVIIYSRGGFKVLKTQQPKMHLLRSLLGVSAMGFAFYAFSLMPLAEAISILNTTPLFMTALSVLILGEKVGRHRWAAVVAGFIGMLIVVRPGVGILQSGSLFMLIAALLIGFTTIIIRYLSVKDDPLCITFYFSLFGIIVSAIGIVLFGWVPPAPNDWLFLIAVGLFGGLAFSLYPLCVAHANDRAQVGKLGSLQATRLASLQFRRQGLHHFHVITALE